MNKNVIVVGGGIAGLAAAIYLARGGRTVTLFEKRRILGGRAITSLRHGFRFNLGPHTVFRKGAGRTVYRELGIPIRGGRARTSALALLGAEQHTLPVSAWSLLSTSLLTAKGKFEAVSLFFRFRAIDTRGLGSMTIAEWLDANVVDPRLRLVMESLVRLATYSSDLTQTASSALEQMKLVLKGAVYIDEGWQKIVDSLHSNAVTSGVNFVTSSRVVGVDIEDGAVRAVEIGGLEADSMETTLEILRIDPPAKGKGTKLAAETVILAVDPATASELVHDAAFAAPWRGLAPMTAACLDVALSSLPQPKRSFALAIDRPLYFGVHSVHAQLTPRGGAMVHALKYQDTNSAKASDHYDVESQRLTESARADERELEAMLDNVQPGWREVLVHRRFLPSLTVSNALVTPGASRPTPMTSVRGLYLAGDWVVAEGTMADAALSSAKASAKAILGS